MSYTQLLYHAVIRTHRSERTITEDHERDLYAYILGMCKNRHVVLYRIGGMPDHIHMLVGLPASLPIAKFIQEIKSVTTVWMRKNPNFPYFDHWSNEYAAFTYAMRDKCHNPQTPVWGLLHCGRRPCPCGSGRLNERSLRELADVSLP